MFYLFVIYLSFLVSPFFIYPSPPNYAKIKENYMNNNQTITPLKDLNLTDRFLFEQAEPFLHYHDHAI